MPKNIAHTFVTHERRVADHAAVRIAMTVAAKSMRQGLLRNVVKADSWESKIPGVFYKDRVGKIAADLSVGPDVLSARPLTSNGGLCWQGCKLVGKHFQISPRKRAEFLVKHFGASPYLPRYWAGRDLVGRSRERYVIDFFGFSTQNLIF